MLYANKRNPILLFCASCRISGIVKRFHQSLKGLEVSIIYCFLKDVDFCIVHFHSANRICENKKNK